DAGVCTQPVALEGRCLDSPQLCANDAGTDGGCVERCEYRPGLGKLDAIPRWSWGPLAKSFPQATDVWSTPAVGRVFDSNCDGKVDELDPPDVIFVSGRAIDA